MKSGQPDRRNLLRDMQARQPLVSEQVARAARADIAAGLPVASVRDGVLVIEGASEACDAQAQAATLA